MNETHFQFERLLAEHEGDVLRVSRSITRDAHLGADAAQETFLRLWSRLESGVLPERPGAWLQRVAVSSALDLCRRERARASESLDADMPPAALESADAVLRQRELAQAFERALGQLSEGQRVVFLLRHEGGMPLSQVAECLGLALPTVKTQFARACLKLQSELRPFHDEDTR